MRPSTRPAPSSSGAICGPRRLLLPYRPAHRAALAERAGEAENVRCGLSRTSEDDTEAGWLYAAPGLCGQRDPAGVLRTVGG